MDRRALADAAFNLSSLVRGAQHNRLLRLNFPHNNGPEGLLLVNTLEANETISRDFRFEVELLSDNANIALKPMIEKMATVSLVREDGSLRHFNGYVTEFRLLRADGGFVFYEMVLEPWLALLKVGLDNRSFHNQSVIEITRSTLADYPFSDWDYRLTGEDAEARITCAIQYEESDSNHLHRRWESQGLAYWYEHRADGHTLVLTDDTSLAAPILATVDGETADYIPFRDQSGSAEDDGIHEWMPHRRLGPSCVTLASFDFKNPIGQKVTRDSMDDSNQTPKAEVYENTGAYGYKDSRTGDPLVKRRMEEFDSRIQLFDAKGNDRTAQVGRSFKLTHHFSGFSNTVRDAALGQPGVASRDYLILSVEHKASNNYHIGRDAPSKYENELTCIRKSIPWRPGRDYNSKSVRIYGPQTAIVVGPPGEEIYTDEYGRVKIQFHWDRLGKRNELSSPWIRVMTTWAGDRFGMISLPRIGQEVVVLFLEGNVDRPLIVGGTFNQDNMPPFDLPKNKTQSGIQTRSTVGAGMDNANVLRFEDRKGKEQLWLHAERDQLTEVEHDEDKWVGNDRRKTIDRDETTIIKHDRIETVGNDENITVKNNRRERVDHNESVSIGGNRDEDVGGNRTKTVAKNEKDRIGKNWSVYVAKMKTETVGMAYMQNVGMGRMDSVGMGYNLNVGLIMATVVGLSKITKVGKIASVSAGEKIEFSCGKSKVVITPNAIHLESDDIHIKASGKVHIDGPGDVLLNAGAAQSAPISNEGRGQ